MRVWRSRRETSSGVLAPGRDRPGRPCRADMQDRDCFVQSDRRMRPVAPISQLPLHNAPVRSACRRSDAPRSRPKPCRPAVPRRFRARSCAAFPIPPKGRVSRAKGWSVLQFASVTRNSAAGAPVCCKHHTSVPRRIGVTCRFALPVRLIDCSGVGSQAGGKHGRETVGAFSRGGA